MFEEFVHDIDGLFGRSAWTGPFGCNQAFPVNAEGELLPVGVAGKKYIVVVPVPGGIVSKSFGFKVRILLQLRFQVIHVSYD